MAGGGVVLVGDFLFWALVCIAILGVLWLVVKLSSSEDSPERTRTPRFFDGGQPIEEVAGDVSLHAVYYYLRSAGEAPRNRLVKQIHPLFPAGYDSGTDWWEDLVAPGLESLPGTEPPTATRETWIYRPKFDEEQTTGKSNGQPGHWFTTPGSTFMHREHQERGRGLLVEVSNGDLDGRFFLKGDTIAPETPRLESKNGTDWVDEARSYLREQY